jgi:hypothetical protein
MGEVHWLMASRASFGLQAGRLMTEIFSAWVQDLALLVESVEGVRPPGARTHWPQHQLRPRHAAQCRRPTTGRHGGQRLLDVMKLPAGEGDG